MLLHLLVGLLITRAVFAPIEGMSPARAGEAHRRLTRWWSHDLCRILRLRVRVEGEPRNGPTLFVANHISWLDIPCLLALLDASFVAKHDVAAWPLIGALATRTDTIFLARGAPGAAAAAAERMTWRLARRRSVIVFPEGTTTDGSSVRVFHARLFQAAIRTHGVVQAVALHYPGADGPSRVAPFVGEDNLLRHLWALLAQESIEVRVTFCPPCRADGDRRRVAADARARITAALGLDAEKQTERTKASRGTRAERTAAAATHS